MAYYTLNERVRRTAEVTVRVAETCRRNRQKQPVPYKRLTEAYGDLLAYMASLRATIETQKAGQEREEMIAGVCTEIAAICVLLVAEVTGVEL